VSQRAQVEAQAQATQARELALDLHTRAERAMVAAIEEHDEARKALRRVSEGAI
jgi:hypothetical protein